MRFPTLLLALFLASIPTIASAQTQTPSTGACTKSIVESVTAQQERFQAVLFGRPPAADVPIGSTRYGLSDGGQWMKIENNLWRSPSADHETIELTNSDMDQFHSRPRWGIFEQQEKTTSELIPSISQSLRAFRCELRSICAAVRASVPQNAPSNLSISVPGCKTQTLSRFRSCQIEGEAAAIDLPAILADCDSIVDAQFDQEMELVKSAVTYDAAYRSFLQFAGHFDRFLENIRMPLLTPLWKMANLLSSFNELPCFLAECNE